VTLHPDYVCNVKLDRGFMFVMLNWWLSLCYVKLPFVCNAKLMALSRDLLYLCHTDIIYCFSMLNWLLCANSKENQSKFRRNSVKIYVHPFDTKDRQMKNIFIDFNQIAVYIRAKITATQLQQRVGKALLCPLLNGGLVPG
jgi:hypothetical protein